MTDFTETKLGGDEVFHGQLLTVHRDQIRLPDGQESVREFVVHRDAAVIIPFLDEQTLLMVRQYRYAIGRHTLEFPAGKIEEGEAPSQAARRELHEETGYLSESMEAIFQLQLPVAYACATASFFLARGLRHVGHPGEPGEFVELIKITLADAMQKIATGEICDMKDVVGLLYLAQQK